MNSRKQVEEPEATLTFTEKVDILFNEIDLAIKWSRPSILFAVYNSGSILSKAKTELEDRLAHLNHKTHVIEISGKNQANFSSEIFKLPRLSHSVLFIDDIKCDRNEDNSGFFEELKRNLEKFIDHRIRVIFWLSEDQVPLFATNAVECWILRHHVVEFQDDPLQSDALMQTLDAAWQAKDETASPDPLSLTAIREIIDDPEKVEANSFHGNLILMLGILYWRKGSSTDAQKFLTVAAEIARKISDPSLETQCRHALGLVQSVPQKSDTAVATPEVATETSAKPEDGQVDPIEAAGSTGGGTVPAEEKVIKASELENPVSDNEAVRSSSEPQNLDPDPVEAAGSPGGQDAAAAAQQDDAAGMADPPGSLEILQPSSELQPTIADPVDAAGSSDQLDVAAMPPAASENEAIEVDTPERGLEMKESDQIFDYTTPAEWNELGNKLLRTGSYNDAIIAFTKAIELAPELSWPYIRNLASAHYHKGKTKGKMSSGKKEEPDIWEAEDDDMEPIVYFNQETIPAARRYDEHPEENVNPDPGASARVANRTVGSSAQEKTSADGQTQNEKTQPIRLASTRSRSNVSPRRVKAEQPNQQAIADVPAVLPPGFKPIPAVEDAGPKNAYDWNTLGNSYASTQDYEQSINAYKKAIEIDPSFGQAYCNLGSVLFQSGKYESAALILRKGLDYMAVPEEKSLAWNRLGDVYRRMRDYGNAMAAYQKAGQLNPDASPVLTRARFSLMDSVAVG